jgi:hypothetical protein
MKEHISKDQLMAQLYGLESHDSHLSDCVECRAQYEALVTRKVQLTAREEVSSDFLAAQRRAVYERMGERPHTMRVWVPAFATAALVVLALVAHNPRESESSAVENQAVVKQTNIKQAVEISDSQLFSDVVSFEQAMDQSEPRAIAPIHGLFEEKE